MNFLSSTDAEGRGQIVVAIVPTWGWKGTEQHFVLFLFTHFLNIYTKILEKIDTSRN